MRRGAPSGWFYWLGEWRPVFSCPAFFDSALMLDPHALPLFSAIMLPLEHMISHVFPWALT